MNVATVTVTIGEALRAAGRQAEGYFAIYLRDFADDCERDRSTDDDPFDGCPLRLVRDETLYHLQTTFRRPVVEVSGSDIVADYLFQWRFDDDEEAAWFRLRYL